MRSLTYLSLIKVLILTCLIQANGEEGILVIHVTDVSGKPVQGLIVTANGDSSQPQTDNAGKARIKLASQTQPNDEVTLSIVRSPVGKNLVFVSPWNNRVRVPPFDNKTENVVEVVLVDAGDRAALENRQVLIALVSRINEANSTKTVDQTITPEQRQLHLAEVAKSYGLEPEQIDQAIREWGSKTSDPYEKGLTALYAQNYPEATKQLSSSLEMRKAILTTSKDKVIEAARFLGQSLFNEGKYQESANAYQEALNLSPNNSSLINDFALSLLAAGSDFARVESLFQQALAIKLKQSSKPDVEMANMNANLGSLYTQYRQFAKAEALFRNTLSILEETQTADNISLATVNQNLGVLYYYQGKYSEAEQYYKRALILLQAIKNVNNLLVTSMYSLALVAANQAKYSEAEVWYKQSIELADRTFGVNHPSYAIILDGLAGLYKKRSNYSQSETLYKQSLSIREKTLGENHTDVALALNNLADLYNYQGKFNEAEPLLKRSLAINEKVYGPSGFEVAANLNNLAVLYFKTKRYLDAEPLYKRALAIYQKSAKSIGLPDTIHNLGKLYFMEGQYEQAKEAYDRALSIRTNTLGPNHPDIAYTLNDMAALYQKRGNALEAERLYKKALAIMETQLPDHLHVATSLDGLAKIYTDENKYIEAEALFKKALQIREQRLPPTHSDVLDTIDGYARLLRKSNRIADAKQLEERATANRTKAQVQPDQ